MFWNLGHIKVGEEQVHSAVSCQQLTSLKEGKKNHQMLSINFLVHYHLSRGGIGAHEVRFDVEWTWWVIMCSYWTLRMKFEMGEDVLVLFRKILLFYLHTPISSAFFSFQLALYPNEFLSDSVQSSDLITRSEVCVWFFFFNLPPCFSIWLI